MTIKILTREQFKKMPFVKDALAFAFYPNIYVRKGYEYIPWLIEHEKKHLEQQEKMGKWKWLFKYAFDKKFRMEQEVEAYKVSIRFGYSINKASKDLSSKKYRLGITYSEALNKFR